MSKRIVVKGLVFLATLATSGGALFAAAHYNHEVLGTFYDCHAAAGLHHDHEAVLALGHERVFIQDDRHHGRVAIAHHGWSQVHASAAYGESEYVRVAWVHGPTAIYFEEHASLDQEGRS